MKIVINRISRMALAGMVMFGLVAELGAKDKLDILKLRQGYLFKEFHPVLDQTYVSIQTITYGWAGILTGIQVTKLVRQLYQVGYIRDALPLKVVKVF